MNRLLLITLLLLGSGFVQAQTKTDAGPSSRAEQRLAIIEKKYASCDSFSSEGIRFACIEETLRDYENEILRLNKEVLSNLCPEMTKTFQSTAQAWAQYFAAEEIHIKNLKECQGTNMLYSNYSSLVQLAKARCVYLTSQLNDFRKP